MTTNKGKANKQVVQGLVNDMNDFNDYVGAELKAMIDQTVRLADSWNDPQYDQFSSFIEELTNSLQKNLDIFKEAAIFLQKKVNMYD